jgi:hypothetical protein
LTETLDGGNAVHGHVWFIATLVQVVRAEYYPTRWEENPSLSGKIKCHQFPQIFGENLSPLVQGLALFSGAAPG